MATNEVMFSELALGDIFSVVTYQEELKDRLFVKVIRPNGKYGAISIDDYERIYTSPSFLVGGAYHFETDCAHWHCRKRGSTERTTPKKETKLIGLYDADSNETVILKVTAEQLKVIYHMYNSGWLNCDEIIENPTPKVTDLTTE